MQLCRERGHKVMVVEMIPGPDSLLSSYYTYRTSNGALLYNYTKSIIRRWPVNRGGACFHQSEWLPETAEMGRRMFDGIGWQGIGNVEFKRDLRDGQLKIIEVNGRLTAGHPLVTRGGAPIDLIIYCHLTGQPLPHFDSYSQTMRLWEPLRDFMAFLQLRRTGELGFRGWISIVAQKIILPFCIDDPLPGLAEFSGFCCWASWFARLWRCVRGPGSMRIDQQRYRQVLEFLLAAGGVDLAQAESVADNLTWCDMAGRRNHGIERLPILLKRVRAGAIKCPCDPQISRLASAIARIDADSGFGHHAAKLGMDLALRTCR